MAQFRCGALNGKQLTDHDRSEARHLADSSPGVTVNDVVRIFVGAKLRQSNE
jgi:hypothetical protein